MALESSKVCDSGWRAVDFDLPGVDGKRYRLADVRGPKGLLVMFICNHCPYVKAVRERIVRDCKELAALGIGAADVVAFGDMPNDIEMLRWAGHGYAMASGHPEAIRAAGQQAPHFDDDGVAQVLEERLASLGVQHS